MTTDTSSAASTNPSSALAGRPGLPDSIEPLLRVTGLTKHFPQFRQTLIKRPDNPVRAVDGVSFHLNRGETLGLVG